MGADARFSSGVQNPGLMDLGENSPKVKSVCEKMGPGGSMQIDPQSGVDSDADDAPGPSPKRG